MKHQQQIQQTHTEFRSAGQNERSTNLEVEDDGPDES